MSIFQPKNGFGLQSNDLVYEEPGYSMTKDPSVAFQKMGVYVPKDHPMLEGRNKHPVGQSTGAMHDITSPAKQVVRANNYNTTNSSVNSVQNNTRNHFQNQSHQGSAKGTQVTRYGFELNQNSQNVFATLTQGNPTFDQSPPGQVQGISLIRTNESSSKGKVTNQNGPYTMKGTVRSDFSADKTHTETAHGMDEQNFSKFMESQPLQ